MRSKTGSYKFWHRYESPQKTTNDQVYLSRLYLFECPFFSVLLQTISGPDLEAHLHDHPWDFVSLILRGHYVEKLPDGRGVHRKWLNLKKAEEFHAVVETWSQPVKSLLLTGPRRREWGFLVDGKWLHFKTYLERWSSK